MATAGMSLRALQPRRRKTDIERKSAPITHGFRGRTTENCCVQGQRTTHSARAHTRGNGSAPTHSYFTALPVVITPATYPLTIRRRFNSPRSNVHDAYYYCLRSSYPLPFSRNDCSTTTFVPHAYKFILRVYDYDNSGHLCRTEFACTVYVRLSCNYGDVSFWNFLK